jgi:hypothetical protein
MRKRSGRVTLFFSQDLMASIQAIHQSNTSLGTDYSLEDTVIELIQSGMASMPEAGIAANARSRAYGKARRWSIIRILGVLKQVSEELKAELPPEDLLNG